MRLVMQVIGGDAAALGGGASYVFESRGGTLGRNRANDWVLPDPNHTVSGHHATIKFSAGSYAITDRSTNGTYVNGSAVPLGQGGTHMLQNGDRLVVGPYEIDVRIETVDTLWSADQTAGRGSPFGQQPAALGVGTAQTDPFGLSSTPQAPSAPADPFAAIAAPRSPQVPQPATGSAQDRTSAGHTDPFAALQSQASQAPVSSAAPFAALPPQPKPQPPAPPPQAAPLVTPWPDVPHAPHVPVPQAPQADPFASLAPAAPTPAPAQPQIPSAHMPQAPAVPPPPPPAGPMPSAVDPSLPGGHALPEPDTPTQIIPDDFNLDDLLGSTPATPHDQPAPAALLPVAPSVSTPQQPLAHPNPSQPAVPAAPSDSDVNIDDLGDKLMADLVSLGLGDQEEGAGAPGATPDQAANRRDPLSVLKRRADDRLPLSGDISPGPLPEVAPPHPAPVPQAMPAPHSAEPPPGLAPLPPQAVVSVSGAAGSDALYEALGIDPAMIPVDRRAETDAMLGRTLAAALSGLVGILAARKFVKDEFRMEQTQIAPSDNNPLKFFHALPDLLKNTIVAPPGGFVDLDTAVSQAIDDIQAHEVAAMSAMQTAMQQLLTRLSPDTIERDLPQRGMMGRSPDKKALWERFVDLHDRLSSDPETATKDIVSDAFTKTYEDHIERVRKTR